MSDKNFETFMNNDDEDLIDEPKTSFLTLFSIVIACIALVGACWYVYDFYKEKNDHEMLLITADHEEIKVEPVEPGGMVVDNMDKSVYEALDKPSENKQEAERVLLPSEEPVDRSTITQAAEPDLAVAEAANSAAPVAESINPIAPDAKEAVAKDIPLLPTIENVPPMVEIKKEKTAEKSKPAPQSTKKIYKVQIASFKSKQDAEKDWNMLLKKHPGLLKEYSHYIAVKEIAGKGTFYRLQIGPFDSSNSARSACNKLQSNGMNCLVVKP